MTYALQKLNQSGAQRIAWLFGRAIHKVTDRGLAAAHLFSDLWLRHLAVTLDVGNNVFPFHAAMITAFRYFANAFLLSLFRKL